MCHYVMQKSGTLEKNVTFDSADCYTTTALTRIYLCVCVHTHSGTMRSLCMYECHTSVSH